MSYFVYPLFLNDWPIDVNWILNWDLDRNFHDFLNFDRRAINVYGLVDVNWFFNDSGHLDSADNFLWNLLNYLDWSLLLNLNVFWNFDYFLNNPFRAHDMLWHFHNNLDRLLYDNLFDNFFWSSASDSRYLIVFLFE